MTKQVNMMMLCFNPRTHVGCDIVIDVPEETIFFVSIHAPTWGATSKQHRIYPLHGVSIHAPTWGATLITCSRLLMLKFQSTHPRGVRLQKNSPSATISTVSIHAPTWGATPVRASVLVAFAVSIHAPTWGATKKT